MISLCLIWAAVKPGTDTSFIFVENPIVATAVSEPEANERGSSLIGKKSHCRGIQSLFLAKRRELWLCANETFMMRNGHARNCGYVRMEDSGCAVD